MAARYCDYLVALRGGEAEFFTAMGLDRARKRHPGEKRIQIFA